MGRSDTDLMTTNAWIYTTVVVDATRSQIKPHDYQKANQFYNHHFYKKQIGCCKKRSKINKKTFSFSILTRSKWGHTVILHYSESQIFVQKFNFDKTPTFSRVLHPKCFWQFFTWNQSCQQLKSPKPQHFHKFFTPKKSTIFSGK